VCARAHAPSHVVSAAWVLHPATLHQVYAPPSTSLFDIPAHSNALRTLRHDPNALRPTHALHTQVAAARQRAEKLREENLYLRDKPPNRSPTALRRMARVEHEKQPVHEHPSTRHNALKQEKAGVTDPAAALSPFDGPQTTEHPRLVPLVLRKSVGGGGGGGGGEEPAVQRVQIRFVPEEGISSASAGVRLIPETEKEEEEEEEEEDCECS